MAVFDREQQRIILRVVYDGAARAGKTTNVRMLNSFFTSRKAGEIIVPREHAGRTLYFDWMDLDGGLVAGQLLRCQFVTVPGQRRLAARRKKILQTADVVVLVCSSALRGRNRARAMLESLRWSLRSVGKESIPIILQANKQDLRTAISPEELRDALEMPPDVPVVGATAHTGAGVRETSVLAIRAAAAEVQKQLLEEGMDALVGRAPLPADLQKDLEDLPQGGARLDEQLLEELEMDNSDDEDELEAEPGGDRLPDGVDVAIGSEPSHPTVTRWHALGSVDARPSAPQQSIVDNSQRDREQAAEPPSQADEVAATEPPPPGEQAPSDDESLAGPELDIMVSGSRTSTLPPRSVLGTQDHAADARDPAKDHDSVAVGPPPDFPEQRAQGADTPPAIAPAPDQAATTPRAQPTVESTAESGGVLDAAGNPDQWPDADVPSGCVWPSTTGRSILREVGEHEVVACPELAGRRGIDNGSGSSDVLIYRAGSWCLKTSRRRRYDSADEGRQALLDLARSKILLGQLLPPQSVVSAQYSDPRSHCWLWTVAPWMVTLRTEMTEASGDSRDLPLAASLARFAVAAVDALLLAVRAEVSLDVHPSNFATRGQVVYYIDDDIERGATIPSIGHALLQRVEEYAHRPEAIRVYVDTIEKQLRERLQPGEVRQLQIHESVEAALVRQPAATEARRRLLAMLNDVTRPKRQ